jgi:hypothetical protein
MAHRCVFCCVGLVERVLAERRQERKRLFDQTIQYASSGSSGSGEVTQCSRKTCLPYSLATRSKSGQHNFNGTSSQSASAPRRLVSSVSGRPGAPAPLGRASRLAGPKGALGGSVSAA